MTHRRRSLPAPEAGQQLAVVVPPVPPSELGQEQMTQGQWAWLQNMFQVVVDNQNILSKRLEEVSSEVSFIMASHLKQTFCSIDFCGNRGTVY